MALQQTENVIGEYGILVYTDDSKGSYDFVVRNLSGQVTHRETLKIGSHLLCRMVFVTIEKDTSRRSRLIKRFIRMKGKKRSGLKVIIHTKKARNVYLTIGVNPDKPKAVAFMTGLHNEKVFRAGECVVQEDSDTLFISDGVFLDSENIPSSGYLIKIPTYPK